jgi:Zn-dependent protease
VTGEQRPSPGIALGRAFGVPVYLRPSWFVVAAVVAYFFTPTVRRVVPGIGTGAVAVALGFAVLLLLSIFVHELAHTAAAALTGTPATHIVLDLWGGHTSFDQESRSPGRSILVAVVGPLSNGVIAVAAAFVARQLEPGSVLWLLVWATAQANGIVAAFNSLPGLPLDGGRVLEALVWKATGDRRTGTLAAGWCGRVVAAGIVLYALSPLLGGGRPTLGGTIWLVLVAWLLWQGASQAIQVARWQRRAPQASVGELMRPATAVPSSASLGSAIAAADAAGAREVVVLDIYGRPAAVVDPRAAADVPVGRVDAVAASAVALSIAPEAVVEAELGGQRLLEQLQAAPHPRYVVVDGSGRVVGVLDWADVAAFVSAR